MLILVSPAKTLDYETPAKTTEYTLPDLLAHSKELIQECRKLTPADIASLMKVSDKIAGLNAARFSSWSADFTLDNAKQAVFAFRGDVYTGLDVDSLSEASLSRVQKQLRILSGLYGLLRPLDLMQPYRLEMGTRLANARGSNLYQFWGDIITEQVNTALAEQGDDIIVNLASNEYFKSVKPKKLNGQLITPIFKDKKNGQYKVISFFAKKARGMMVRYIVENEVNDYDALIKFDVAGYYYSEAESSLHEPVFLREEQ
ncbi:peroxide stress protein YaaA [Shewanella psychrotolerans]|uniref:peroxide stress protein YaaA n=1 Tax=Shewanella psychrotolerans TaxID=2864206 RepID=UPI001C656825|nr:peroxide stress protein YaaA [Shewanella psychrotolerans]QYK00609.1 peroxide stress protein YaaA [Shewanella psychrotolerans]